MNDQSIAFDAQDAWLAVYQLREDKQHIEAVQRATLTARKFGIAKTHGLFGSPEWWNAISTGKLVLHTLQGVITKLYMGGMNDTPELIVRSDDGKESSWLRYANNKKLSDVYAVGKRIEIDYALQRHRFLSDGNFFRRHKVVTAVRIANSSSTGKP